MLVLYATFGTLAVRARTIFAFATFIPRITCSRNSYGRKARWRFWIQPKRESVNNKITMPLTKEPTRSTIQKATANQCLKPLRVCQLERITSHIRVCTDSTTQPNRITFDIPTRTRLIVSEVVVVTSSQRPFSRKKAAASARFGAVDGLGLVHDRGA